jgi:hypothetical protein
LATASGAAGTRDEPLITLGYLRGDYASSLKDEAAKTFGAAVDAATARLGEIFRKHTGYRFAPRFLNVYLKNGGALTLYAGASFILLSGTATLTVAKGTVINVSTGNAVGSGEKLSLYQRYFCTENTQALVSANTLSTGQVDGYYTMTGGGYAKLHPVFKDVLETDWYFDAVCYAYDNGLFKGTEDDIFSPDVIMTRAMFVTVLHRLNESRKRQGASSLPGADGKLFTDVPNGWWYTDAVLWATANGMITGYDDGTFRPDAALTREQMAAIIYRYASYEGLNTASGSGLYDTLPDTGDVSDYAVPAMRWVVSRGVINGSDGKLMPRSSATRAQVAQIFMNYCKLT